MSQYSKKQLLASISLAGVMTFSQAVNVVGVSAVAVAGPKPSTIAAIPATKAAPTSTKSEALVSDAERYASFGPTILKALEKGNCEQAMKLADEAMDIEQPPPAAGSGTGGYDIPETQRAIDMAMVFCSRPDLGQEDGAFEPLFPEP